MITLLKTLMVPILLLVVLSVVYAIATGVIHISTLSH